MSYEYAITLETTFEKFITDHCRDSFNILILGNRYVVSMNVLKQSSYTFTKTKLSLLIRIDQFPAFVTSEEGFRTSRDIIINNTSWYWYIGIRLRNQSKTYLATYLTGSGIIKKDSSFDVEAKFKFKHHPTAKEQVATEKFSFNSSNGYKSFGHPRKLAPIDVIIILSFLKD